MFVSKSIVQENIIEHSIENYQNIFKKKTKLNTYFSMFSSYVRFDIIRRILSEFFNIDVIQVMGITDIDDKIIKRSQESSIPFTQLTKGYQEEFFQDMNSLNVSTSKLGILYVRC